MRSRPISAPSGAKTCTPPAAVLQTLPSMSTRNPSAAPGLMSAKSRPLVQRASPVTS
jgi:hypothetical protein